MKTLLCLVSVTTCCLVTLSLTTANPLQSDATESTTTENTSTSAGSLSFPLPTLGYLNGSKLVITNVVKTLQFDVELEEVDNSTDSEERTITPFIDTDIEVLNPMLLEEVVSELHPTEDQSPSIDGTKVNDDDDD